MSKSIIHRIKTINPIELIIAMLNYYTQNARISFEGDLSSFDFPKEIKGNNGKEEILKRATRTPKLDFIIIPLYQNNRDEIIKEITNKSECFEKIIHIQIECNGMIVFGAYDNFDKDCVFVSNDVRTSFLDELINKKVIKKYDSQIRAE